MFTEHKSRAFMLSFLITYIVAWSISDQFFGMIAEIAPILNGILKVLAILSVVFLSLEGFAHFKFKTNSSDMLRGAANKLKSYKPERTIRAEKEINTDVKNDKKEKKQVNKSLKETKREINTIDDMNDNLSDMETLLKKKGSNLDNNDIGKLRHDIRALSNEEKALDSSDQILTDSLNLYKLRHTKQLEETRNRLESVRDNTERRPLLQLIDDHKKALDIIARIKNLEEKGKELHREFRRNMSFAMIRLNQNQAPAAPGYINRARRYLSEFQNAIKHQRSMERDLLDIAKKTIYNLKQEKDALDS